MHVGSVVVCEGACRGIPRPIIDRSAKGSVTSCLEGLYPDVRNFVAGLSVLKYVISLVSVERKLDHCASN